jgi:hypothetical protein
VPERKVSQNKDERIGKGKPWNTKKENRQMIPHIAVGLCYEYFNNWTIMLKAVSLCGNGYTGYRLRANSGSSLP